MELLQKIQTCSFVTSFNDTRYWRTVINIALRLIDLLGATSQRRIDLGRSNGRVEYGLRVVASVTDTESSGARTECGRRYSVTNQSWSLRGDRSGSFDSSRYLVPCRGRLGRRPQSAHHVHAGKLRACRRQWRRDSLPLRWKARRQRRSIWSKVNFWSMVKYVFHQFLCYLITLPTKLPPSTFQHCFLCIDGARKILLVLIYGLTK